VAIAFAGWHSGALESRRSSPSHCANASKKGRFHVIYLPMVILLNGLYFKEACQWISVIHRARGSRYDAFTPWSICCDFSASGYLAYESEHMTEYSETERPKRFFGQYRGGQRGRRFFSSKRFCLSNVRSLGSGAGEDRPPRSMGSYRRACGCADPHGGRLCRHCLISPKPWQAPTHQVTFYRLQRKDQLQHYGKETTTRILEMENE
jgi:hypothetical protein